jgi:hypothetical protein
MWIMGVEMLGCGILWDIVGYCGRIGILDISQYPIQSHNISFDLTSCILQTPEYPIGSHNISQYLTISHNIS